MKKDNKGFSLVELIVVVAIMAVLMTVLAPQLLKYVEQSRLQKDNSAIAEIANAVKIAMANETINAAVGTGTTIEIGTDATGHKKIAFDTTDELEAELASVVGANYSTTSNTYRDSTVKIEIVVSNTSGVITVSAIGWYDAVGGDPTTGDADSSGSIDGTEVAAKVF